MSQPIFKASSITKEFSGVRVLNDVSLELAAGEVLGIIGENGAGKSTLLKIISGIYQPTSGRMFLNGAEVEVKSPIIAKRLGISMVPQEFNLISTLAVYQNIFLGSELVRGGILDKNRMRKRSAELLGVLGAEISPDASTGRLGVAQKQMVEIAKALVHDSKILILDEPTTVLTKDEVRTLFDRLAELRSQGVAVMFISHKLSEVRQFCDRVLILRDGDLISIRSTDDIDEHEMALGMVGRELTQLFPDKTEPGSEPALEVSGLSVPEAVNSVDFTLYQGEVLGIAGLLGSGQTEMAEAVVGLVRASAGRVSVCGARISLGSPALAVKAGIAYLSEDRQDKGLILNMDIPSNISLISLKNYGRLLLNRKAERKKASEYVDAFSIRAASLAQELQFLSGGNQQKVYLSKWMDTNPKVLILNEPTRGIDVNAKSELYHFVNQLAGSGIGCLIISSEMEELLGMCSRVLVMAGGEIAGELSGSEINEQSIMLHAAGLRRNGQAVEAGHS